MLKTAGNRRFGFTLTEIIVCLVVASVLIHFAIPAFQATIERMRAKEGEQILLSILGAQMRYKIDHGGYASNLADLDIEPRPASYFNTPFLDTTGLTVPEGTTGLAAIQHVSTEYTLILDDSGGISCYSTSSTVCPKLGY